MVSHYTSKTINKTIVLFENKSNKFNKHDYIEAQLIPIFFKNFLLSNKTNKPPKDNKNSYI